MGGQPVSYALRKDGLGWRAVGCPGDCSDDEVFSVEQPVIDTSRFLRINQIKDALSAIDARTPRAMREALLTGDKSRVQALESEAATLRAELAGLAN